MSDLEKTVKIIFSGEDTDLSRSLKNITGGMDSLSGIADKVSAPLAKATDSVLKVDAALAALAVGAMVMAVKESSNFNEEFALISTSVDATGTDLGKYRDQILEYSRTSVKSMSDINGALYTAAQAGIKYGDSLEFMGKAEQLAVANKANLNTTVDLLTGTMNAYGYKISDVGHLNDVFFESTLIGKQTIDDLGQSMGNVVGIAANFGVSFESLSAAISTLTAKGMETSEAITAVKGVITTIVSPSAEAAKAAADLGLNFSASALKARGFEGTISDIMKATGGSADKMAVLFNEVRALNGVMQLTGDGMTFFNDALQKINNSAGASEAAYQKMVRAFTNQSQMLINIAKVVMVDVGTKLEPIAAEISSSFSKILSGIDIGIKAGAFDPLFKMIEEAGKELSAYLAGIAKVLPEALQDLDFSKLIDAFRALGSAISDYFGDLDLTKVEDLHEFIQQIIDGIAGLIRVTEGMVEGFRPFFTAIKNFLLSVAESDEETQKMIGTIMSLGKMVQETCLYFVVAVRTIDEFGVNMKGLFNIIGGGIQVIWNLISEIANLSKMFDLLVQGKFSEIPKLFQSMLDDGRDIETGVGKIVTGFGQLNTGSSAAAITVDGLRKALINVPAETKAKVSVDVQSDEELKKKLQASYDAFNLTLKTKIDEPSLKVAEGTIAEKFGGNKIIQITTNLDGTTTIESIGKLNAAIPTEKVVEIKPDITQTEISKIKETSEIIQKSIEWKAKIDIAQIESATKIMEAAFKSVDATIENTGKTLTDLTGSYVLLNQAHRGGTAFVEQQIADESRRRDEALKMQKDLLDAQIKNLNARTNAMKSGQAMIQIDGKGLQPQLEAFMFEILKSIQVRANAEGAQFLVGM
jgi:TP901 family phage tail tape measure protein